MSEDQPKLPNRQTPFTDEFKAFIAKDWAPYSDQLPEPLPASKWTAARQQQLHESFPKDRLVFPAGGLKVRNNDCDYRYRPDTAFAYYTGLGEDREPDAVLVLEPAGDHHEPVLYFKPRAPRTDPEFYANARYGEMWVGQRESLDEMAALVGFTVRPIDELEDALAKNLDQTPIRVLRLADAEVAARVDQLRKDGEAGLKTDAELEIAASEARLVKDEFEIAEMEAACAATAVGFTEVVKQIPQALANGRGERWVEGVFGLHARHQGNAVGYDTIAASGDHANTLHWIRNDGDLRPGDLMLMDAGVEINSLYTADITRTLPLSGTFSPAQRKVYDAVLAAQEAGMAAARPGAKFADVHKASIKVIAEHLVEWGLLDVTPEQAVEQGLVRRWMVHGTSHHLGIDVHDCAQARNEQYRQGELREGMVITVEPGIYFRQNDLLVPEELRGIGVRIEDDIVITADGNRNLSHHLPRRADELEAWMAPLLKG